jgi:hypothetical protein
MQIKLNMRAHQRTCYVEMLTVGNVFLFSVLVKEEHDTATSGRIAASPLRAAGNVGR